MRKVLRPAVLGLALLAVPASAHAKGRPLDQIGHIVVIYEENHSFDNLYGGWEGVDGLENARRAHDAGRPGRHAVQVPAPERRQPDVAAAHARPARHGEAFSQPLPERAVPHRELHRARGHDLPAAGRVRPQRRAEGRGPARRLHARPRAPLLPGALPDRRRQAGPLCHRLGRRRPDDGPLRHAPAARSTSTCTRASHPRYAIADRFFQAAFGGSFLNHQWLVAAASPVFSRPTAAPTTSTRSSTPTGCRTATRSTRRPGRCGHGADRRPARRANGRAVRRLRRQHDPADLPAVLARHRRRAGCRRRPARRSATA